MYLIAINILILLILSASTHDLPNYFPRCALDDSNLNECLGRAANVLRPYIRKGIKEIKFPSFDPLIVSQIAITQESNPVNYTGVVWNFTVGGLDNYDITEIRYDPKTLRFNGKIEVDSLALSTLYTITGRWIGIQVEGTGAGTLDIGRTNGTFEVFGKIVKYKGIDHYKPTSTKIRILFGDSCYYLGGLFNGNEQLGRLTNDLINQNSNMITDGLTPVFEKLAESGLMSLMKSLTKMIPYEQLFSSSHISRDEMH